MDKGFIRIAAALVAACVLLIALVAFVPGDLQGGTAHPGAAYVGQFFPQDRVFDIHVQLDPADWEDMLANPLAEEYKLATVIIDGVKVQRVGIRTKGNSSLISVAGSDSDRYSFKIDFSRYIKVQSLAGLSKLNLNNSFSDPSYIREYLSYQLMAELGVPAPATAYANVYINGELHGLYLAVEGIEESFVKRYFGNDYGSLYKADQGATLVYNGDDRDAYPSVRLMTAEKPGAPEALVAMIRAINTGEKLEEHLDIPAILRYFAVNNVMVNTDSYIGNFAHNYYLYEKDGVFTVLPWDYNMSFGGFGGGPTMSVNAPTSFSQRPLLGSLLSIDEYKEMYLGFVEEMINGPFALDKLSAEIERLVTMLRPHVEKDPTKFYTVEQFEQATSDVGASGGMFGGSQMAPQGARAPMGGGLMMFGGGSSISLPDFIEQRIEFVVRELAGEVEGEPTQSAGGFDFGGGPGGFPFAGGGFAFEPGAMPFFDPETMSEAGPGPGRLFGADASRPAEQRGELPGGDPQTAVGAAPFDRQTAAFTFPDMEGINPPARGNPGFPAGDNFGAFPFGGRGEVPVEPADLTEYLTATAAGLILVLACLVLVFRRKTKHSI